MTAVSELKTTAAEYLESERTAKEKHEFLDGAVYAMSGSTINHDRIARNLSRRLDEQVDDRPCENFTSDMRVAPDEDSAYFYPDASGLCGPPLLADGRRDTLLNPSFIAEVLSESTEAYDRGEKFARYRQIETFRDYLLVSQYKVSAELFHRNPDGGWIIENFDDPEAVITIRSLDCQLRLGDLYRKVDFGSKSPKQDEPSTRL